MLMLRPELERWPEMYAFLTCSLLDLLLIMLNKDYQTTLLGLSTLVVTFASSVFSSATTVVAEEFNIGTVTATLGTSLFVLGYAVGPLSKFHLV